MATKTKQKSARNAENDKNGNGSGRAPSFLGLLNAIAVAETEAERYLIGWANVSPDPQVAEALRFVAMREGEHGKAFSKRMLELGYEVRSPPSVASDAKFAIACSSMSDLEKFEAFGVGRKPGQPDVFDRMFENKDLDPVTAGLLGRYIAEERDSGRILHDARAAAEAADKKARKKAKKEAKAAAKKSKKKSGSKSNSKKSKKSKNKKSKKSKKSKKAKKK